jgi:Domain of unknown function (DUF4262)
MNYVDNLNKILVNLETPGWSNLGVTTSDEFRPQFAYTAGLWKNFKHPEIIVFGLPMKVAFSALTNVGLRIKEKQAQFQPQQNYEGIFKGYPAQFRAIKIINHSAIKDIDHFGLAIQFYGEEQFDVLQLFWPDKQHRFPWEKACDAIVKMGQPPQGFWGNENIPMFESEGHW